MEADEAVVWAALRQRSELFVRTILHAEPDDYWQQDALAAYDEHQYLAIRSGHGPGKTAVFSWIVLHFIYCFFPCRIISLAPTKHQLLDILWAEIALWHNRITPKYRDRVKVAASGAQLLEAPKESFAVAKTARKENPESLQGFHCKNVLIIGDEASGIPDKWIETVEGALTDNEDGRKRMLLGGNPTRASGYFHSVFRQQLRGWNRIHVSSLGSPRVSEQWVQGIKDKYGEDSNVYRIRVLGEFPKDDPDIVIPFELADSAVLRDVEPLQYRPVWGVDVARHGDDRTTVCKRQGNVVLEKVVAWQGADIWQTAETIATMYEDTDAHMRPHKICVDGIGYGAGVVDSLVRHWHLPAMAVNVARSAVSKNYVSMRDELWFRIKEWLEVGDSQLPDDPELVNELTTAHYSIMPGTKRIKIEDKEDLRKEMIEKGSDFRSTDLAEALMMTFAIDARVPIVAQYQHGARMMGERKRHGLIR